MKCKMVNSFQIGSKVLNFYTPAVLLFRKRQIYSSWSQMPVAIQQNTLFAVHEADLEASHAGAQEFLKI